MRRRQGQRLGGEPRRAGLRDAVHDGQAAVDPRVAGEARVFQPRLLEDVADGPVRVAVLGLNHLQQIGLLAEFSGICGKFLQDFENIVYSSRFENVSQTKYICIL